MRNYSKLSPFFWLKGSGKRLRGDALAQSIAAYLSTCPDANMVGIFFVSLATIASHTGHDIPTVRAALERIAVAKYAYYDFDAEMVWIPNHAHFEIGEAMKPADKRRGKVLQELSQVGGHPFVQQFRVRYGVAFCISANDVGLPDLSVEMPLPELPEGASAIQGQDKHRTGQTQDRVRSKGASAPTPSPETVVHSGDPVPDDAREKHESLTLMRPQRTPVADTWAKFCNHFTGKHFPSRAALIARWDTWVRDQWTFEGQAKRGSKVDTRQPLMGPEPDWLKRAKTGTDGTEPF